MSGAYGGIEDADMGVLACVRVSVRRRRHLADGPGGWSRGRAGAGVAGVAGRAAGRHGERVGCGAALPVIFWRSPGRAAG